jgi:hypothetical protein
MNPTTLEKPKHQKPPKAAASLSFTLETTGDWEVIGTPKPGTGTGTIKLEFTGNPGGILNINIEPGIQPDPPPHRFQLWTIKGDGNLTLFAGPQGGKAPREQWIGPITCMIKTAREVTFTSK